MQPSEDDRQSQAKDEPVARPRSSQQAARQNTATGARLWTERPVTRWGLLRHKPRARASTALVFIRRSGEALCFTADRQPTYGELLWSSIETMYEVDTGRRQTVVSTTLPSFGDAFEFTAEIVLTWQVLRPVEAVRRNIQDLGAKLEPLLSHELRALSRRHRVEDTEAAENELNEHLRARAAKARQHLEIGVPIDALSEEEHLPGVAYGVHLTAVVRLRTDQHAIDFATVGRQIDLERETQKLRELQEEHNRELISTRIEHYRGIIELGDLNRFALRLANNPDDVPAVIDAIRAEATTNRAQTIDFVSRLVESGAISAYQIEDQVREALDWLKAGTDRVLGKPIESKGAAIPQRRRVEAAEVPEATLPAQAEVPLAERRSPGRQE